MPHVRPSVHGPKTMFSNAFTPFQNCSLWAVAFATHGKSVRRGYAPPFSSHVRWGEPGFPVTPLRDTTACAPFSKERRMKLAEATNLDRKSGERGAPLQTFNARRENKRLLVQLSLLPGPGSPSPAAAAVYLNEISATKSIAPLIWTALPESSPGRSPGIW